jgi:tRNA uridine 5-carboxymethylaminomethyl modification enzyme
VTEEQYTTYLLRKAKLDEVIQYLKTHSIKPGLEINTFLNQLGHGSLPGGITGFELLKRPQISLENLYPYLDQLKNFDLDETLKLTLDVTIKFSGYIEKEVKQASQFARYEMVALPQDIDYLSLQGMAMEARQKLDKIKPLTIGQASRISGVNPTDISQLVMQLKKRTYSNELNHTS